MHKEQALPTRICCECGVRFTPPSRAAALRRNGSAFCCAEHRKRFHRIMEKRGQVLLPFAQVSRKGKSGYDETAKYALRQFNALVDAFNAADKAAGRRVDLIVRRKEVDLWSAADLQARNRPSRESDDSVGIDA